MRRVAANQTTLPFVSHKVNPDPRLICPLNEFYEQLGLPLPAVARVDGWDMPEPYRNLLVHNRDMTPTLERAYDRSIQLHVLRSTLAGGVLTRQVVLVAEGSQVPVAFGASKIHLEHFPEDAKPLVVEGKQPLGAILRTQGIEHAGCPEVYLQVTADALIHFALSLTKPATLYGRRNSLVDAAGRTLAQVVEILPPRNGNSNTERNRAQSESL
jgi:chorismate-pyruvate lyase